MNRKKILVVVCSALLLLSVSTACMREVPKADANGNIITYKSVEDVPAAGFYILDDEGIHPLYRDGRNFNESPEEGDDLTKRLLFMIDDESLVPVLSADDVLIYINDKQSLTQDVTYERLSDQGYTMGISFSPDPETMYLGFKNIEIVPGSASETSFSEISNASAYTLRQINGVDLTKSLLDDNGFIKNLDADAKYKIDGYRGTQFVEFVSIADVHLYMSASFVTIPRDSAYGLTKNGYAVVAIPAVFADGFYCINGFGVFHYQADPSAPAMEETNPITPMDTTVIPETNPAMTATGDDAINSELIVDLDALGIETYNATGDDIDGNQSYPADE